jgi:hypothetical protein
MDARVVDMHIWASSALVLEEIADLLCFNIQLVQRSWFLGRKHTPLGNMRMEDKQQVEG